MIGGCPDFERQVQAQPTNRDAVIVGLATSFVGLGASSGRDVREDDRGFDLVAMLPAWTGSPGAEDFAIAEQFGLGKARGMDRESDRFIRHGAAGV